MATTAKRTSGHAALDDSMRSSDSGDSPGSPHSTALFTFRNDVRRIKPMPKRARLLRPASAVSPPEPNVQPSSSNATLSIQFSDSSSSESSSPPAPALRSSARLRGVRRDLGTSGDARDVRYGVDSSSDSDESDDHDERGDMEGFHALRLSVLIRDTQDAFATHIPARSHSVHPRREPVTRSASNVASGSSTLLDM